MVSSVGKLVPTVKLTSGLLGTKTDSAADDTAFGRIEKNKSVVEFKETSGSFIAPRLKLQGGLCRLVTP